MVRHTSDNDKKPRPRQADRPGGPRKSAAGEVKSSRYSADRPSAADPKLTGKPRGKPGGKPGKPGKDAKAEPAAPKRSERIAKAMARAGIASRREVERLIGLGKVAVNGRILETPATLVTRDDIITVDGKPMVAAQATRVWRYHKPAGLLTSHNDPAGRPTVFDALPAGLPRVISVGRLDLATEGLLLLTNDGELSRALELPTTALVRQYRARARGRVTQVELDKLKTGCTVDGVHYGPIEATLDKAKDPTDPEGRGPANLWISVSITEGKNREVRKVLESIGLTVNRLIRLAYGPFQLGTLAIGQVEEVGPRVIRELLAEHIRPENLPTGNTVETPAPTPGRRTSMPKVRGNTNSAMSDPSRKPSRTRAAETAQEDAVARRDRPAKKPAGWAKAAPRDDRPKRPFKPREDKFIGPKSDSWAKDATTARNDRDRPKRDFKPRDGAPARGDGPKREYKPRDAAASRSDGPKRDFKPRDGAPPRGDGPKRDFKPRAGGKPGGRSSGGAGKPRGPGPRGPRSGG